MTPFSRRVQAAVPEALDFLPEEWASRDRLARALVERVLAAADQATGPHVWLLWGRREEMPPELFGCFADRETALAAEDAAKKLPRERDWVDIWVTPWENRTTPKLRVAVARSLARKPDSELARLRDENEKLCDYVKEAAGDQSVLLPVRALEMMSAESDGLRAAVRSLRTTLVAIVNTRDGETDNVWQRMARSALSEPVAPKEGPDER